MRRTELAYLARRAWETLREEGPAATWLRARRRFRGDQGRLYADYQGWLRLMPGGPRTTAPREGPLISVLIPVADPPPDCLRGLLGALREQHYRSWEVCLADDAGRDPAVAAVLAAAARDPRFRVVRLEERGGITAATRAALELARGEWLALVDHDDLLAPEALGCLAQAALADPQVELIYTDEDKVEPDGRRRAPFFKPGFDPVLLESWNYVGHLLALRRDLLERAGGLRPGFDGAQDYDLTLRLSELAGRVAHVPLPLYHWRAAPGSTARSPGAKPWAHAAARRALEEALRRRGEEARVEPGPFLGTHRVRRRGVEPARVSVVLDGEAPRWLSGLGLGEVLHEPGGAPSAARRNRLAGRARGDWLLFLADVRPAGPPAQALAALLEQAGRPQVAFVTPKLLRRGRLHELGLVLAPRAAEPGWLEAVALETGLAPDDPGTFGLADAPRCVAAAGGYALLVERQAFTALGGFPPGQPSAWASAVALTAAAGREGLGTVTAPWSRFELTAEGAGSLGPERWHGPGLDPWLNPNLRPQDPGLRLAELPRAHAPAAVPGGPRRTMATRSPPLS